MADNSEKGALTEGVYYILLSLHAPMHGYGIMQNVRLLSRERLNIGPGTLYGAITTLLERGWITSLPGEVDSRKKCYVITPEGRSIVRQEMARLEELLENGRGITTEVAL